MLKLPGSLFTQLRLGVAPDGAALLKVNRRHRECSVMAEASFRLEPPEALAGRLRTLLANTQCAGMPVTIVLADRWVRLFMVTPPQNAAGLRDCEAAAAMRFQALYGESMATWQLSADWDARQPFLACATPRPLIAGLRQLARDYRWTLLSIAPQFVAAWNRCHKQLDGQAWFGVAHDDRLTLAGIERGRLCAIGVSNVDGNIWPDESALRIHLQREALRLDLSPPQQLRLCGHVPNLPAAKIGISSFCKRIDTITPQPGISATASLAHTGMSA